MEKKYATRVLVSLNCVCGKYSDRNNLIGVILFPLTVQGHNPALHEQPQWQKLEAAGHI